MAGQMTTSGKTPNAPLSGIRVIELGSLIAGPMAGRILGDFGAEVIKVENPRSGDPLRVWGHEFVDDRGLWWAVQSRNKQCIALDLKSEEGVDVLRRLIAEADILVENFRPGTLERLGLSPDSLWSINPGLVIARISGYGQTGDWADRPGYAAVAEAAGGLRHMNGFAGGPPPRAGISLGDSLSALYAVQGILMALYWRDAAGGTGQIVDVSLAEACFSMLEAAVPEYAAAGYVRGPSGTRLDGIAPSNVYRSSDDKWIVIAANQDSVFARLCEAMNSPQLSDDPRFHDHVARGRHQDELDGIIATWTQTLSAEKIRIVLDEHGVPTSPVNTIADIFTERQFTQRDMLVEVTDAAWGPVMHPGIVPRLTRSPGSIQWNGAPVVGFHTADVLEALVGVDADEQRGLAQRGVIA